MGNSNVAMGGTVQEWGDGRGQADYPLVKIFQGVADHEDHGTLS